MDFISKKFGFLGCTISICSFSIRNTLQKWVLPNSQTFKGKLSTRNTLSIKFWVSSLKINSVTCIKLRRVRLNWLRSHIFGNKWRKFFFTNENQAFSESMPKNSPHIAIVIISESLKRALSKLGRNFTSFGATFLYKSSIKTKDTKKNLPKFLILCYNFL